MSIISQGLGGGFAPGKEIEVVIETADFSIVTEVEKTIVTSEIITIELSTEKTNDFPIDESEELINTEC